MVEADPINPQRVFSELSSRLPDNCILTSDAGSAANWYARTIRMRRDDGVALGDAGHHGVRRSVRRRREVRVSRPCRHRARRGRRDADERPERAHHRREVLAPVGRPAARSDGAQQPRPEHGHVGAARARGRSEVRGYAGLARLPTRATRSCSGSKASASIRPTRSARHGTRCSPPTGRRCSRQSPIRKCRRCPHITFDQARNFMLAIARGDKSWRDMIEQSMKGGRSSRSSFRASADRRGVLQ